MIALTNDYEPVLASLLHQDPFLTLEDALPHLKSKEIRLGLLQPKTDLAFAVTDKMGKSCRQCHQPGHLLPECPTMECRTYKKKAHIAANCPCLVCRYCKLPKHLIDNCATHPPRPD